MGKMYILPKDAEGRQPCLPNEALPRYYMSDHSVMGILVREFDEATLILEKQNWPLAKTDAGIEVFVENAAQMEEIFRGLKKSGLDFEMADILGQVIRGDKWASCLDGEARFRLWKRPPCSQPPGGHWQ